MRALRWGVLGVLAVLALPRAAAAFWPFTRDMRVTLPDSATVARTDSMFEIWKVGGDVRVVPAAADSTPAAPPSPGDLHTMVIRANDAAANAPPPPGPAPPGAPAPDTTAAGTPALGTATQGSADSIAAASSWAKPDSLAGADSLAADQGPFGNLAGQPGANAPTTTPLTGAAAAAVVALGFTPRFDSGIQSSSDYMRTTNNVGISFSDPTGVTLTSALSYGTDLSFTQGTDQRTSGITNRLDLPLRKHGLVFGLSTSNNRLRQEGQRSISNAATNTFSDTRGAEASARVSRRLSTLPGLGPLRPALRGWGADLFYARRVGANTRSTVATQGSGAGETRHQDTGNSYGVGVTFDRLKWIAVRARVGTARRSNQDQTAIDQPEVESTSQGDTASVDVNMPSMWMLTNVTLRLSTNEGTDTSVDLARSSTGSVSSAVGSYVLDTHSSLRNQVTLGAQYHWGRFDLKLNGDAGRIYDSYDIRANAFNDTRRYGYTLGSTFAFWQGILLTANYEAHSSDVNQDENDVPNANTRRDDGSKLYVEAAKKFTETMTVKLYGESQLDQSFYDHEGPSGLSDRDELRQRVGVDFSGAIGKRISAQATLYYRTYDQAFIDPRRSSQSRDESEYIVRPSYTWTLTEHVTLRQSFGLASKVIDVIYSPNQNTLNRNHYMRTEMDARLTERLQVNLAWDYRLQDNGSYFTTAGTTERFFSPTSRTKTDALGVGVRYAIIGHDKLTFSSRQDAQRLHTYSFTNAEPRLRSVTDSGNLAIGFDSKLDFKDLKLDCRATRNQSFNVSLNRKVYYNVDATLSYTF